MPAEVQEPAWLHSLLAPFAPGDVAWANGTREWKAKEVAAWLDAAAGIAATPSQGRKVALAVRSHLDLARLLVLLDGQASALLLVPADWPNQVWPERFHAAGIETLIADQAAPVGLEVETLQPAVLLEADGTVASPRPNVGPGTRVLIPTSGTTGTPKLVSHSWATLARTVRVGTDMVCRRWGLLYELTRFAGLQVFLQALASRATLIFTDHLPEFEAKLEFLIAQGCDALSATPTLWRKILMSPTGRGLPLRQITLGGEIADDQVLNALARAFPLARVTHIYASTEAGVGFSVKDGRAGFPSGFLVRPPGGVELRVDGEGRLWLRPRVRGQFLVGERESGLEIEDGWIDSGDLVERRGDRYYFLGRANGAINVGGDKVFPEEVERVILELPAVAMVKVTGRRNPIVGALVEAAVLPRERPVDPSALVDLLRQHCQARLSRFKVPAVIRVVPTLEVEGSGKLSRK